MSKLRKLLLIAPLVLALGAGILLAVASGWDTPSSRAGAAGVTFSSYNTQSAASAIHLIGGTSAFPNFEPGAVHNRFPLAITALDNAPSSSATASMADTGPPGALGAATLAEELKQAGFPPEIGEQFTGQPQYAHSEFPGQASPSTVGGGSAGYASTDANEMMASAEAAAAASASPMPPASSSASAESERFVVLGRALDTWRSHYFPNYLPPKASSAGTSAAAEEGAQSDSATSLTSYDKAAGVIHTKVDARVSGASMGGGLFAAKGVAVHVETQNDGKDPKVTALSVDPGNVEINGIPVSVSDRGITVVGQGLPGSEGLGKQASDALNQALVSANTEVFVVAPQTTIKDGSVKVEASGLHVRSKIASASPGVPAFDIEYILAEAVTFNFAQLGEPFEDIALPDDGGEVDYSSGESTYTGGYTGGTVSQDTGTTTGIQTGGGQVTQPGQMVLASKSHRHRDLLLAFLTWESLLVATGASMLWARKARVVEE